MTQSAGIQLQVGLDLAFFRQQLTTLGATAAGYKLPINVQFDRRSVQNELNALGANIKKRNYFLEVKTNLASEIKNAKDLATALNDLAVAQKAAKSGMVQRLGVGAIGRTPSQGGLGSKDVEKLYRASARAGLLAFDKEIARSKVSMVAAMEAVGIDSIAGLLNGLNSQNAQLKEAAQSLGKDLLASVKNVLGIASPSKKFEEIGKNVGQGFEKGALSSMDNAFDALENKMRQRGKILDTVARGIFRMLGMDPAAMLQQARALPPLNFGATVPRAPAGIGPSSSGRMLPAAPSRTAIAGTPAPAGLLPSLSSAGQSKAIIEALIASTGPRLLPSGGGDDTLGKLAAPRQTKDAVDAILRNYFKVVEAQVREVFSAPPIKKESLNIFDHLDTEQYFNYLAQARVNAENAIRQSIEEAKQVARRNQVKDAAQSFLRALEETVRNAERSVFVQSRIAANQSYVQKANIREIGQPLLGERQVVAPKMLSAATGFYRGAAVSPPPPETQAQLFARREREARMRSALRGIDVMGETPTRGPARYSYANRPAMPRRPTSAIVPYAAGGALVPAGGGSGGGGGFPPGGMTGGRQGPATFIGAGSQMEKFKTALDIASASTRNFNANQLPLIGGIKNLAGEFGEATKQVLLYGTAYKGLAFLTSLPGQVLNAAKSQQQFNNGLKVATQDTGTFAKELLYVDNVQRAFGLNLETTRTGFTRLYASMAPTGFDSGSIEKLFTGISAATASLQLTPDKAERVIYAFGQMASKGQIMSEELKGQLGDVLPGALAIFSKAAGMSVKEFSKAMEDGEFVGNRFREVFAKVSDELMNRFGSGAAAAGKSLQGLINTVGGDFQRTLESFAPLANAAAQATLGPLAGMLKEVSMAAQIAMGEQDRVRKQLKAAQADVSTLQAGGADAKEIKAAEQNVAALAAKYQVLNEAAKDPAISQQVKNIEAFVVEVQKAATFTMNLAGAIGSTLSPLFTILGGNLTSVIGNLALLVIGFNAMKLAALLSAGVLTTMNAVVAAGGSISAMAAAKNTILAGAFRLVGVQATGAQIATITFGTALKGLLISTGIGALVVLLGSLAASALSVGDAFSAAAAKTKQSMDEMKNAVSTGNVALAKSQLSTATQSRNDIEEQVKYLEEMKALAAKQGGKGRPFVQTNLARQMSLQAAGFDLKGKKELDLNDLLGQVSALRADALNLEQRGVVSVRQAQTKATQLGLDKPTPGVTPPKTPEEDKKKTSPESYHSLQDQLAKNFTQHQIELLNIEHQHKVSLMNVFYDLQETRANSHQKAAIRFQKELYNIAAEYQGAQLKAQAEVIKAQGSVAGGVQGASVSGATGLLQGSTGISSGAHFDVRRQDGGYISPGQARALFDPSVRKQLAMTSAYGPRRAPVPGASTFHKGVDLAGPANTPLNLAPGFTMTGAGEKGGLGYAASVRGPAGEMYDVGHLQRPKAGVGAPGKITADQSRNVKADQQTQLAIQKEKVSVALQEVEAVRKMEVAMENYVASLVPVAEQDLQNRLLAQRIQLTTDIASPAVLDAQIKYAEQEAMATENIRLNNAEIAKLSQAKDANGRISVATAARIEILRQANEKLKTSLPTSQVQLLTEAIGKQTLSIIEQVNAKRREAEDSRQVNRLIIEGMTRQEAEAKVAADRFRGDYAKALEIANEAIQKISSEQEIYNIRKAQNIALTKGETDEYNRLAIALEEAKKSRDALEGKASGVEGAATALETSAAPKTPSGAIEDRIVKLKEEIADLTNIGNIAITVADGIGAAFGQAFQGLISGSMSAKEALSGFFKSVGDMFVSMAAEIIAKQMVMITLQLILKALGAFTGGGGGGTPTPGSAPQMTPGAIVTPTGFSGQFAGIAANGATFANGIATFAKGSAFTNSIVSGPTMFEFADGGMMKPGLMGEAGPEAIMPLSRGAGGRLGVDASGLRESMDRQGSAAPVSPVLNMSFESTSIGGVEYVSRDQLEQAMAETRRNATRDGASRGMTMTLDRIQNSSSTRRRIGV